MKRQQIINILALLLLFSGLTSCGQAIQNNDYLLRFGNDSTDGYGYKNTNGDIVIPVGKYDMCFTDTFKTYAVVAMPDSLFFVAIDRAENTLYKVFLFDNGPDEASNGLFRITENNKIGYADAATGAIVIKPQFDCALPFEEGVAKVSNTCTTLKIGEYGTWVSDNWHYIDKTGMKVEKPKLINE